ncbi:MAG: NUDIX hydrolase [Firmicutes bacterium]|nr:NUDIX hydrolase [Bacillota bacterium]
MEKPKLTKEQVEPLIETKYMNMLDLHYRQTGHYYSATRRKPDDTVALYSDSEFRAMLPDAANCAVIVLCPDGEPRMLLTKEFRYPVGQYLLSPPAGLIDSRDISEPDPVISAAVREIREETGLELGEGDRIFKINHLCFSTPGMTDESNALVCAVVRLPEGFEFSSDFTEESEYIGDYALYSKEDALELIKRGTDREGVFYSVYTLAALLYFLSDLWKEEV